MPKQSKPSQGKQKRKAKEFKKAISAVFRGAVSLQRGRVLVTLSGQSLSGWLKKLLEKHGPEGEHKDHVSFQQLTTETTDGLRAAPLLAHAGSESFADSLREWIAKDPLSRPDAAALLTDPRCLEPLCSLVLTVVCACRRPCNLIVLRSIASVLMQAASDATWDDFIAPLTRGPEKYTAEVSDRLHGLPGSSHQAVDSAVQTLLDAGVVTHNEGGFLSASRELKRAVHKWLKNTGAPVEPNLHDMLASNLHDLLFQQSGDLDALREYIHHRMKSAEHTDEKVKFTRQRLALRVLWQHRRQIAREGCSPLAHGYLQEIKTQWQNKQPSQQRNYLLRLACDLEADLLARQHQFRPSAELRLRQIAHRLDELGRARKLADELPPEAPSEPDAVVRLEKHWLGLMERALEGEGDEQLLRELGDELERAFLDVDVRLPAALRALSQLISLAGSWKGMRAFQASDRLLHQVMLKIRRSAPSDDGAFPLSESLPLLRLEVEAFRILISSHLERIQIWNWVSSYNVQLLEAAQKLHDLGHRRLLQYFDRYPVYDDSGDQFFAKMKRNMSSLQALISVYRGARLHAELLKDQVEGQPTEDREQRLEKMEAEFDQARRYGKLALRLGQEIPHGEPAMLICRLVQAHALILQSDVWFRHEDDSQSAAGVNALRSAKSLIYGVERVLISENQHVPWWYWLAWLKAQICHEECLWSLAAPKGGLKEEEFDDALCDGLMSAHSGLRLLRDGDSRSEYFEVLRLQLAVCHAARCLLEGRRADEIKPRWEQMQSDWGLREQARIDPRLWKLAEQRILTLGKPVLANLREEVLAIERHAVEAGIMTSPSASSKPDPVKPFYADPRRLQELQAEAEEPSESTVEDLAQP